ncbi:MAG: Fic family protein [Cellulomonas sp.]|nr:Fic family protein [Cellulomonas sp.]
MSDAQEPPRDPIVVPATGAEERYWIVPEGAPVGRARAKAASGPYAAAVPATISDYRPSLPSAVAADVEEAAAELAGFDSYAKAALGPDSPTLGPMSSILLRTESTSSSQIENLTVGARQLALAEIDQSGSENAKVVVANVRAMEAALELSDHLDEASILRMHEELISRQPGWEQHAGRYRDALVWVGTSSVSPRGALHVAPEAENVPAAMRDLIAFLQRDDLPVLVQAAVAHAQFETIHPFADGNGRTGRAMVHAVLRNKGVLTSTTAPVSAGLLRETEQYFAALQSYRAGDARPIIERFTDASLFAARSGAVLVDDLAREAEASRQLMSSLRPQAGAWKVLPHLVAHPVVNARFLIDHLGMNEVSAQRALAALSTAGVLEERAGKRRNRVWQHAGILGILDDYAARLRRR